MWSQCSAYGNQIQEDGAARAQGGTRQSAGELCGAARYDRAAHVEPRIRAQDGLGLGAVGCELCARLGKSAALFDQPPNRCHWSSPFVRSVRATQSATWPWSPLKSADRS